MSFETDLVGGRDPYNLYSVSAEGVLGLSSLRPLLPALPPVMVVPHS